MGVPGMSLLDNGPHVVTVFPMVLQKTRYNTWRKVRGEGIKLEGVAVQPFGGGTQGNLETNDQQVNDQWTVRGRGVWPGGVHSIVEWNGEEFDQVGKVKAHTIGHFTKHYQVRIQARSAEVK